MMRKVLFQLKKKLREKFHLPNPFRFRDALFSANEKILDAWSENDINRLEAVLSMLFTDLRGDKELMDEKILRDFLVSVHGGLQSDWLEADDKISKGNSTTVGDIDKPVGDLILLYGWLISVGFFRTAVLVRTRISKTVLRKPLRHRLLYPRLYFGAIAEDGLDTIPEFLRESWPIDLAKSVAPLKKRLARPKYWPSMLEINEPKLNSDGDIAFAALIEGKNVAIFGPASSDLTEFIREANDYDIVVVIKPKYDIYKELWSTLEESKSKLVIYTNGKAGNGEKIEIGEYEDIDDKHKFVSYIVFKNEKVFSNFGESYIPTRVMIRNELRVNGTFTAIPNIVFDILYFRPIFLKIYNATLMLPGADGRTHAPTYRSASSQQQSRSLMKGFLIHDPLLQFKWLKLLYLRGLIAADETLESILQYDEDEYMRRLRDAHARVALSHLVTRDNSKC